jgi:hypothetical protein
LNATLFGVGESTTEFKRRRAKMRKIFRGPTLQLARSEKPHPGRVPVVTIAPDLARTNINLAATNSRAFRFGPLAPAQNTGDVKGDFGGEGWGEGPRKIPAGITNACQLVQGEMKLLRSTA